MRINSPRFLNGVQYLAPVSLLLLASCGGGGGGGGTTPPPPSTYTIGGTITGLTGTGLKLRNNGGDDLTIAAGTASYTFTTAVASGGSYNVTVLTDPSTPTQRCTVANGSGSNLAANITSANVTCVTAYTIGGTITGTSAGIGPTLQNNLGDNLFIPAITTGTTNFTFSTPVASGSTYSVTQLTRGSAPPQNCTVVSGGTGTVAAANVTSVTVNCSATTPIAKFAYVTNSTSNTVQAYTINTGAPVGGITSVGAAATGNVPYSVAVDPAGKFAYVTNSNDHTVSAYSINSGTGALTLPTSIATGNIPYSVMIHPSGKFAYVANEGVGLNGNSISAYSINPTTGALAAIDADSAAGTQAVIAAGTNPFAVTVDPTGKFVYVVNDASNNISVYTIDQVTGALTAGTAVAAGTNPRSIAISPTGTHAFVANGGSNNVSTYSIGPSGALTPVGTYAAGSAPRSVSVDPSGAYVYVANAGSNNVSAFTNTSGVLASVAGSPFAAGSVPFSVSVGPSGAYVYVVNYGTGLVSGSVSVYSINVGGALTPLSTPTFPTGNGPTSIATSQ